MEWFARIIDEYLGPVGALAMVLAVIAGVIFMARHESKRRSLNQKKLTEKSERDKMEAEERGNQNNENNL